MEKKVLDMPSDDSSNKKTTKLNLLTKLLKCLPFILDAKKEDGPVFELLTAC